MLRKLFPTVTRRVGTIVPDIGGFVPSTRSTRSISSTRRAAMLFTTSNGGTRPSMPQRSVIGRKVYYNTSVNPQVSDGVPTMGSKGSLGLIGDAKPSDELVTTTKLIRSDFWKRIMSIEDKAGQEPYAREIELFHDVVKRQNDGHDEYMEETVATYLTNIRRHAPTDEEKEMWDELSDLELPAGSEYIKKVLKAMAEAVPPTITQCLTTLSNAKTPTLKSLSVMVGGQENTKDCFFITHPGINFRHKGTSTQVPSQVYLQRIIDEEQPKVAVFMSSSGTGKTVELAGSGYTRDSHLAVFVPFKHDIQIKRAPNTADDVYKIERQNMAMEMFSKNLDAVLNASSDVFVRICQAAVQTNETLKLVICIDEASAYPLLVRALIAEYPAYQTISKQKMQALRGFSTTTLDIEVLFSVAGTGAARTTVGSNIDNFEVRQTSASAHPKEVYETLKAELTEPLKSKIVQIEGIEQMVPIPSYDTIQADHPFLGVLLKNARMCSIALPWIVQATGFMRTPSFEATIVERTIEMYMNSNGMRALLGNPRESAITGARALAVYLFQKPYEIETGEKAEEKALNMMYGPEFEAYDDLPADDTNPSHDEFSILKIVQTYGLLEARPFLEKEGETLHKPFDLSPSMQLVALYLMKIDPQCVEATEPSPYGFKVLSTHIIKCVVAASVTIREEDRPTLGELFATHLNVDKGDKNVGTTGGEGELNVDKGDKNVGTTGGEGESEDGEDGEDGEDEGEVKAHDSATTKTMETRWGAMKDMIAVSSHVAGVGAAGMHPKECWMTMQQRVQQAIEQDVEGNNCVRADGELNDPTVLKLQYNGKSEGNNYYAPPVASIGFGNSHLADGYVTFMAKPKVGAPGEAEKVSIMVQAKDYRAASSSLDATKLNKRAELCYDGCLNRQYGAKRLLVVAGSNDVVFLKKRGKVRRDFVSFGVDRLGAVEELMQALEGMRKTTKTGEHKRTKYYLSDGRSFTYTTMKQTRKVAKDAKDEAVAAAEKA